MKILISTSKFSLIGCHKDSFEARLLTGSISKSQENNSKKHCIEKCKHEGYSLAGMQYGYECFCGEKSIKDLTNFKIEEEKCNKKCPGASTEICGGYLTMNIYHTGSVPSKPGPSVLPVPGKKIFIHCEGNILLAERQSNMSHSHNT